MTTAITHPSGRTAVSDLGDFDPNTKPTYLWATYCPGRWNGGKFKTHAQRGYAMSAFANHSSGIVYHWEGGRWQEVLRKDNGLKPERCNMCGTSTVSQETAYNGRTFIRNRVKFVVRRDQNGKLLKVLSGEWRCPDCARVP